MNPAEFVGFAAAIIATGSFVPQVVKTWKTKHTRDLSLAMYVFFCIGISLWLVYGILIRSPSVIAANAVTVVLALSILFLKIKYG